MTNLSLTDIAASLDAVAEEKAASRKRPLKVIYEELAPQLQKLIEEGCTYDEVGKLLNERGVKVSVHTNRIYIANVLKRTKEEKNE